MFLEAVSVCVKHVWLMQAPDMKHFRRHHQIFHESADQLCRVIALDVTIKSDPIQ